MFGYTRREYKLKLKPWITQGIISSIKHRDYLFRVYKRSKLLTDFESYKKFRNHLTHIKELAKRKYYEEQFAQNSRNSKRTWTLINDIFGKTKPSSFPQRLKVVGRIYSSTKLIADALNHSFVTSAQANFTPTGSSKTTDTHIKKYLLPRQVNSNFLSPTTPEEILTLINGLESKKSCGHDDIPVRTLKLSKYLLEPLLSNVINEIICDGVLPDNLKIAKVVQIFKSGDSEIPTNYRPISVLTYFSKIFEKVLHVRLNDYFTKSSLLSQQQYGFRYNHSTSLAIADLYENLLHNRDKKLISRAVFLDLRKAFGVRGNALKRIQSYLSKRKQYIQGGNIKSSLNSIISDFWDPPGLNSRLTVLFFLIFINDLAKSNSMKSILFADDTVLVQSDNNRGKLQNSVNHEMTKVMDWLTANKLLLYISKTKYMLITNKHVNTESFVINVNNNRIERTLTYRYLGVIVDETLTWKEHCKQLCCTISKYVGVMYKVKHYVNNQALRMLYHSLINSRVRYGITAWGKAASCPLQPISVVLNRTMRCLNADKPLTNKVITIYKMQKFLQLKDIFNLEVSKFMYK